MMEAIRGCQRRAVDSRMERRCTVESGTGGAARRDGVVEMTKF
jgi:hypothetical protein